MRHKLIALFLTVWVLLALALPAYAQDFEPGRTGSVSVTLIDPDGTTLITGAELALYRVATVTLSASRKLSYLYTDTFADCGFPLYDPALTAKLDRYVKENTLPAQHQVTDDRGTAAFTDLPMGLYFVEQTNSLPGYAPCSSFLVMVPFQDGDNFVYEVNATPKTDVARLTDITVRKVWNTDASTQAADRVTVQLLQGETVVQTAVLNAANNWQVTFYDLPEHDGYSIRELDIPKGFTATYSRSGYTFTVTNTASLPETGQLVWPIPVLALAGLALIAVGTVALKKSGQRDG